MAKGQIAQTAMFTFLMIGFSSACNQVPMDSLDDLGREAHETIKNAERKGEELRELSEAEIGKLWAIEYTTIQVTGPDLETLDGKLNELGKQRWDCYYVSENKNGKTFYFKRRQSNTLRYLTGLLKLLPFAPDWGS